MKFRLFKFRKEPKLYTRCNELPIHNFNEVATNNDFSYLKKNRDDVVSEVLLQDAWLGILDEFIRISKNSMAINIIKKKTSLVFLEKRLDVLEAIRINIHYGNDVDAVCKEYRVKKNHIDSHIGILKNDIIRIQNAIPDNEEQSDNSQSETEFDKSIAIIMKSGYKINRFETVVSEWCAILNIIKQQKTAA